MTDPRALPRVLAAWRDVADQQPLVTARCDSCRQVVGCVYDSAMGALLHYFQPVAGRAVNVTVSPEDRATVHRVTTEESPEHYGIAKWAIDRDRALLADLSDDVGSLVILDRDDYWIADEWSCERHGFAPIARAALMDRYRRARSANKSTVLGVGMFPPDR